jgi:hypothetical protein
MDILWIYSGAIANFIIHGFHILFPVSIAAKI